MSYVVFNSKSPHADKRYFKTASAAKRSVTCSNRNAGAAVYAYMHELLFAASYPVGTKTVKSLMTGKDVEISEDTPLCCDPSSETYWSM
jgi:hypothetical protein